MCNPYNSSTLALYHVRQTKMLEKCANNIHLMLIKNEQKYVNNLYISKKALKTVHKKIKANYLNIIQTLQCINNYFVSLKKTSKTPLF